MPRTFTLSIVQESIRLFAAVRGRKNGGLRPDRRATPKTRRRLVLDALGLGLTPLEERIAMASQVLGGLEFDYSGSPGQLVLSGTTSQPVQIGLQPAQGEIFVPLLSLVGNTTLVPGNGTPSFIVNGELFTSFGGSETNIDLLGGLANSTFDINTLTGPGQAVCGTISSLAALAGGQLGVSLIRMDRNATSNSPQLDLTGNLGLTGVAGLVVDLASNGSTVTGVTGCFSASPNLTIGSLAFAPQNLGLSWSQGQLSLWGDTSANIGSGPVSGQFGNQSSPGIAFSNGSLTSASLGVTGTFTVDGITFTTKGLQLNYSQPSAGHASWAMTGAAGFSLGGQSVDVAFGSGGSSGLVVTDGTLTSLDMAITSNIAVDSLQFQTAALRLTDNVGTSTYQVTGSTTVAIGPDTLDVDFLGPQGLMIVGGSVASIDASISGNLTIGAVTVVPEQLALNYSGNATFITGQANVAIGADTLGLSFNGNQGLAIVGGGVAAVNASLSGNISIGSLAVQPRQLSLNYTANGPTFITGGANVAIGSDNLDVMFNGSQGLVIDQGAVSAVNASLSGQLTIGSLTAQAEQLSLNYTANGPTFITGGANLVIGPDNLDVMFNGSQGLVIDQGAVSAVNGTLEGNLHVGGLTITANQLTLNYNAARTSITGGANFSLDSGNTLDIDFSGANGLLISGGSVASMDAIVTGQFSLSGANFYANGLALNYSGSGNVSITGVAGFSLSAGDQACVAFSSPGGMVFTGGSLSAINATLNGCLALSGLTATVANATIAYQAATGNAPSSLGLSGSLALGFGSQAANDQNNIVVALNRVGNTPGLLIQNGALESLDASFSGNISLFGCTLSVPGSDAITIDYNRAQDQFEFSGSLIFSNHDQTFNQMTAALGSPASPGLILKAGDVSSLNVSLSGSFDLFDIATTINSLDVSYSSSASSLVITGGVSVSLGSGLASSFSLTDGGLTINTQTGDMNIDGFTANLADVNLGFLTIENFSLSYTSANSLWNANLAVQFPLGWSVDATLQLENGTINEIGLAYSAGTSEGIPVGDTGLFVTSISTTLDNLEQPDNLTVTGSIGVTYGKQVSVAGYSGAILLATGSFLIDPDGLTLDANVTMLGGLATGNGNLTLDWASGQYSLAISENILDGTFVVDAEVQFDSTGDLLITAMAAVNVPSAMPVIGGDNLGSINFALKYLYNNGNPTFFAAAWTTVHFWFIHETVGFEWDNGFSFLGSDGVSNIVSQLSLPNPAPGQNPTGSGLYPLVQWSNIDTLPSSSNTTNSAGNSVTVPPGTSTISLQGETAYNWGSNLALVTSDSAGTIWTSLANFPAGTTEFVDLNGGTVQLYSTNNALPSFPVNDMTITANYSGSTLMGYVVLSGDSRIAYITNNSNSNTYTPALAYLTVTTTQVTPGASNSGFQYNVVIQAIPYFNQNLPCYTYYLETYYSSAYPDAVPALTSSVNSTVYTQPTIQSLSAGNVLLPSNQAAFDVTSPYLEAIDTQTSFTTGQLPELMSYYASDLNSTITPGLYRQDQGVWRLAASAAPFQPTAIGMNQNALVWNWLSGGKLPADTLYKFGFTETLASTAGPGTSQSIFLNNSRGSWLSTADPLVNPTQSASFPVVVQAGSGDSLISRQNVDQYSGQVYINVQQTFPADDLPSSFTYFAVNNSALTPLLFSVGTGGVYELAAMGQSVQATNLNGLNTSQIVWSNWGGNKVGPILGTSYAVGFSDRQFITQNGTTTQTVSSGTIPFDDTAATFAFTESPNPMGSLNAGQTFAISGSADFTLNTGRAYSVLFFSGTQTSANKITLAGSVSPSLANSTEIDFFVTSDSSPTGGRLVCRSNLTLGGLNINASTGQFTAIFDPATVKLPPGANYFYAVVNDGVNPPLTSGVTSPVINGVSPAVTGNVATRLGDPVNGARIAIGLFDGQISVAGSPAVNIGPADGHSGLVFFDTADSFNTNSLPTAIHFYAGNCNAFTPFLYYVNGGGAFTVAMVGETIQPLKPGANFQSIVWLEGLAQPGMTYYLGIEQADANGQFTTGTISESSGQGPWLGATMIDAAVVGSSYSVATQPLGLALAIISGGNLMATGSATTFGNGQFVWDRPEGLMAQPYEVLATITPPAGFSLTAGQPQMQTAFWNGLPGSSVAVDFNLSPPSGVSGTLDYSISGPITTLSSRVAGQALPMPNVRVFDDVNRNGKFDQGEPYVLTDSKGRYALRLAEGDHLVTVDLPDGFRPGIDFERARHVSLSNSTEVKHVGWNALKAQPQSPPVSQVLSPTRAVVHATPHFNRDADGHLTDGYSVWLGQITGTAADADGAGDLQSVVVSVYDETARKYYYDATSAVDAKRRWTSATWVQSRTPVYLTAQGTANWLLDLPVMSLVNGHRYTVRSLAIDKEGHMQASAASRTFTFDSPYRRPSLVLQPPAGRVVQAGVVNLKAFVVKQFAGQAPPAGSLIVQIDGHARRLNFYNTAVLKFRLTPGRHTITVRLPGNTVYPTLTSNTVRLSVVPKGCAADKK